MYDAATDPINGILQPSDLSGVGEYRLAASAVSPAVNVLCVGMTEEELAPLVYVKWPNANITKAENQTYETGWEHWEREVPHPDGNWTTEPVLNSTVVDTIFRWGKEYHRRPPVFQRVRIFLSPYLTSLIKFG